MHDIYHLLEADRPDEPRQPIPAPVGERDKSDERYAPGHDPKAVDGDGVPVACSATAANVNDTIVFERLFLTAFAVMARIRAVFADKTT